MYNILFNESHTVARYLRRYQVHALSKDQKYTTLARLVSSRTRNINMSEARILDVATIKDLLNHIYEKRKATAFQIEGYTKSALARNDSATIFKIIAELTELANGGSTSAKMGAITALGSVSVALGSFAIAYFLEEIVTPIFATFRDTDARVRYYACESLYNIAKIARGEILLYFNEVFDILCILVTDTESSVKNAADILDRLIKDIVSSKLTNYVSVLHQQPEETDVQSNIVLPDGVAVQVNEIQDPLKAFLLPKFIPTLLERMYTIEPFAKKFLLSWLELFDDIPSSELITFLPNFLEPLIRFLMNNCPSDVRIETQNLLNIFLKEIRAIYKVRYEVKRDRLLAEKLKQRAEFLRSQAQVNAQSTPEPEDTKSKLALTEKMRDFSLNANPESPDDDNISTKSTSTTIIRKPNDDEQGPEVADTEATFNSAEGSVFINGQDIFIDYPRIIDILLSFLRTNRPAGTSDVKFNDLTGESHDVYVDIQLTVLKWLLEIISISPTSFSKFLPDYVSIIMQNVALTDVNNDVELNKQFLDFNNMLKSYLLRLNDASRLEEVHLEIGPDDLSEVSESIIQGLNREVYDEFLELYLGKTLQVVTKECLLSLNELARLTLLDWLAFLYTNYPGSFSASETDDSTEKSTTNRYNFDVISLLKLATDASNEVISKVLQLASRISEENQDFFKHFIVKLVTFFERDGSIGATQNGTSNQTISRSKVEFIIRRFCVTNSSEKIFKAFSEVLVTFESTNLEFISNLVVTLNNILLTSHELQDLRKVLKNLDIYKADDWALFSTLFQSWCHNVPSALSLCLLTSNYELSYLIIKSLADLEVTFQLLTQLDVLVQLLESHIFLKLRLQLLEPDKNPYLYKTLFGILMIMPQSSTFNTLKNRLTALTLFVQGQQNIPVLGTPVTTPAATSSSAANQLSTKRKRVHELADKFVRVNEMHENYLYERRVKDSSLEEEGAKSNRKVTNVLLPKSESKPLLQEYFPNTYGKHQTHDKSKLNG